MNTFTVIILYLRTLKNRKEVKSHGHRASKRNIKDLNSGGLHCFCNTMKTVGLIWCQGSQRLWLEMLPWNIADRNDKKWIAECCLSYSQTSGRGGIDIAGSGSDIWVV